ncbi:zinc ribbon domain-containing protein [Candidatus Desantisbacteria bacterium]|nr:zinc ribbon domain-containing protein [Candidatus Desantisbacteria bacterium]
MPVYEYKCKKCNLKFEELQSIGADAPPCPKCKAGEVVKCISVFGFSSGGEKDYSSSGGSSCSSCSGGNCSSCK